MFIQTHSVLLVAIVFLFGLLCGYLCLKITGKKDKSVSAYPRPASPDIMTLLNVQGREIREINTRLASTVATLENAQGEHFQKIANASSQRETALRTNLDEKSYALKEQFSGLLHLVRQEQEKGRTSHAKALREISELFNQNVQAQTSTLRSAVDSKLQTLTDQFSELKNAIKQEQEKGRTTHAQAIQEIADRFNRQMNAVKSSVTEQLHQAVEKQMESSFQRVVEQFKQMQQAMGEIRHMTAQVGDLKRLFSNVKARGGWGEAQLKTILDDILPPGAWQQNVKIAGSNNIVEFAIHIPVRRDQSPLLCIDSKFPTESYERLLQADEHNNQEAIDTARKELKRTVRLEAQKISEKYIHRPQTVDYGIMYVPTDSLYMEITRIPGLLDEIGRRFRIFVMGPVLMAALLRTIHLGYVNVALDEHTETIARLLAETQQEMLKMDDVLEKLARQTSTVSNSIDKARQRTRVLKRKLDKGASSIHEMAALPMDQENPSSDNTPIEKDT